MSADQLIDVLSLYGFEQSDGVATALRTACNEESVQKFVQWLSENFRPRLEAQSSEYQLSRQESQVAQSFTAALDPLSEGASIDSVTAARRSATIALLKDAEKGLRTEAKPVSRWSRELSEGLSESVHHLDCTCNSAMYRQDFEIYANLLVIAGARAATEGKGAAGDEGFQAERAGK